MMEGVKVRAEGGFVSKRADDAQVFLWAVTFGAFVASGVLALVGRRWRWHVVTFLVAGLLFGFLTLIQPSPLFGGPLVIALCAAVWGRRRH